MPFKTFLLVVYAPLRKSRRRPPKREGTVSSCLYVQKPSCRRASDDQSATRVVIVQGHQDTRTGSTASRQEAHTCEHSLQRRGAQEGPPKRRKSRRASGVPARYCFWGVVVVVVVQCALVILTA